ncbi:preprotein translocase subunit SecE [bacterium]|nr:preprotein translocase subunit SecE [bacterium]
MLAASLYKRNQGRLTRQLTAAAIFAAIAVGAWALFQTALADLEKPVQYGITAALVVLGAWFAYRIVNYPAFADFLVDVEGEMAKVSWPSKDELLRATAVVLVTMFLLSFVLFMYDLIWQQLLRAIGIIKF